LAAAGRICARTVALACALAALIQVGSVQAATRHVAYGKPGKVQLLKIEGSHAVAADKPLVVFPGHWIRRSPLAAGAGKRQRVCTKLQIWTQVGSPPTSWAVRASSRNWCAWLKPNTQVNIGKWSWPGTVGTPYHAEFVVTWATRTRKLAKATYDFNALLDYTCVTRFCLVDTDQTTNFPYIAFN
jgi:hypothetical protein